MVTKDKCHWCGTDVLVCRCIPDDEWKKANAVQVKGWDGQMEIHIGYACRKCEKDLQKRYPNHNYGSSGIPGDINLSI